MSTTVIVKTGLVTGIITFFITRSQIDYPFGKRAQSDTHSPNVSPVTPEINPPIPPSTATALQDHSIPRTTSGSTPIPTSEKADSSTPTTAGMKECLSCHKQVEALRHTCPNCGGTAFMQAASGQAAVNMLEQVPAPVKKTNSTRNIVIIVVIVAIVLCCVCLGGSLIYFCGDMLTGAGGCGF